jgi:hypothetical protein
VRRGASAGAAIAGTVADASAGWKASTPGLRCAAPSRSRTAPPIIRNGIFGSPGTSANRQMTPPATSGALRWPRIWPAISEPRSRSDADRVTMMPVATEISSAGIWAARPSPTVSSE